MNVGVGGSAVDRLEDDDDDDDLLCVVVDMIEEARPLDDRDVDDDGDNCLVFGGVRLGRGNGFGTFDTLVQEGEMTGVVNLELGGKVWLKASVGIVVDGDTGRRHVGRTRAG